MHVADAAMDAVDVGARLRQARVNMLVDLEGFAAVMESQFVGMLSGAVADHARGLRKGVHQILHVRRRADSREDEHLPAA